MGFPDLLNLAYAFYIIPLWFYWLLLKLLLLLCDRTPEDTDVHPPCMSDVFKCMGKAARAALCAIARHLRLRSE